MLCFNKIAINKNYKNIYQFKILLHEIEPEIWRLIEVPESYTFWELHVAIQDAMGWLDSHLHEFIPKGTSDVHIGIQKVLWIQILWQAGPYQSLNIFENQEMPRFTNTILAMDGRMRLN